jgi:hypothetical protein
LTVPYGPSKSAAEQAGEARVVNLEDRVDARRMRRAQKLAWHDQVWRCIPLCVWSIRVPILCMWWTGSVSIRWRGGGRLRVPCRPTLSSGVKLRGESASRRWREDSEDVKFQGI